MRRRADPMESRSFPRLVAIEDTIAALLSLPNIAQSLENGTGGCFRQPLLIRLSLSEQYRTVRLELRSVG